MRAVTHSTLDSLLVLSRASVKITARPKARISLTSGPVRELPAQGPPPPDGVYPRDEGEELGSFPGQLKRLRVEGGFDLVATRLHEIKNGLHRGERLPPLEEQHRFDGAQRQDSQPLGFSPQDGIVGNQDSTGFHCQGENRLIIGADRGHPEVEGLANGKSFLSPRSQRSQELARAGSACAFLDHLTAHHGGNENLLEESADLLQAFAFSEPDHRVGVQDRDHAVLGRDIRDLSAKGLKRT